MAWPNSEGETHLYRWRAGNGQVAAGHVYRRADQHGRDMACGEGHVPQGSVLVLSAEDGDADTTVPRLHAARADLGRVHIISAVRTSYSAIRGFNLQADIELLEQKIAELGDVALITIDPISSYLGKTDSHKNAEVRGVLEPLSAMAERTRVAVLSVTHFSKAGAANTTKALHRFIGSIAFVGAPRMAFAVIEDAEDKDRRLLLHAKNNLAASPQGLAFRLRQTIVGEPRKGIVASRVDWDVEPVDITANEALAAEAGNTSAKPREEAEAFLKELLADGPVAARQVKADANDAGLSWATIRRAKARIGLVVSREGFGPGSVIRWALPDTIGAQNCIEAHFNNVGTYEESEHLCKAPAKPQKTIDEADFEERAAVLEFDGGLSREEAEAQAATEFPDIPDFLRRVQ
jgi:putative DNA primase/helicase